MLLERFRRREASRTTGSASHGVTTASQTALFLARVLVVAAVFAPFWYWNRGLIEIEALEFIQHYLDGRGLLQKVFDPYTNDLGTYQARELSYFLDYLDARLFSLLMARGYVILIPASALVASLLTIVIFFYGARRYHAVPALTATLILLLYFSNYVHLVTMGMFYRSSKPMLAPVLMGTAFYLLSLVADNSRGASGGRSPKRAALVAFGLFCVMSLLDRQGFFYALVGLAVLLCHAAFAGGRRDVPLAAGAAVVAMTLYTVILAPYIVERVNRYSPSLEFQTQPLTHLLTDTSHFTRAGELLVQASALLMGGMPYWLCLGVFALLLVLAFRKWPTLMGPAVHSTSPPRVRTRFWTRGTISLVCVLVALAQVSMFAAMIVRHPPIWEHYDHRLWYYPLPFQALLTAVLLALFGHIVSGWKRQRLAALNVILVAGVIANAAQWGDYTRLQRQSQWFSTVYNQTYILKQSLSDGRPYSTHPGYLAFYRYCLTLSPPLRARAERLASQN